MNGPVRVFRGDGVGGQRVAGHRLAQLRSGRGVDHAGRREAVGGLERRHRLAGVGARLAVDLAGRESGSIQGDLNRYRRTFPGRLFPIRLRGTFPSAPARAGADKRTAQATAIRRIEPPATLDTVAASPDVDAPTCKHDAQGLGLTTADAGLPPPPPPRSSSPPSSSPASSSSSSVRLIPGDVVDLMMAQNDISAVRDRARIEAALGLDHPIHVQYFRWAGAALRGDLGRSLWRNTPVVDVSRRTSPDHLRARLLALADRALGGDPDRRLLGAAPGHLRATTSRARSRS